MYNTLIILGKEKNSVVCLNYTISKLISLVFYSNKVLYLTFCIVSLIFRISIFVRKFPLMFQLVSNIQTLYVGAELTSWRNPEINKILYIIIIQIFNSIMYVFAY